MALCYKYWRRDPGGFPILDQSGSPLFCNGGLATTCCPQKYYFNCNPVEDDHDGVDEPPCEIPDHYTGRWAIYAVCDVYEDYGCQIVPRPRVTVPCGVGGCEIDFAVLCDWALGRVSYTVENSSETAHGTMCVTVNGKTYCKDISYSKGDTATFYVEIPEEDGDAAFGTESHVLPIVTRITLSDGRFWDINGYVWCQEYMGNRYPGSMDILPEGLIDVGMQVRAETVGNEPDTWRLRLNTLKFGYDSWSEAAAVFEAHHDALKAYAESCVCGLYGRNSCWIVCDFPGGIDPDTGFYKLERYAHEGGCSGVITGDAWWELISVTANPPVMIIIKDLENGTHYVWEGGSMMLPPCHELAFYIDDPDDLPEDGACGGEAARLSPPDDCTQAIRCAFCDIDGTSAGIDCSLEVCP